MAQNKTLTCNFWYLEHLFKLVPTGFEKILYEISQIAFVIALCPHNVNNIRQTFLKSLFLGSGEFNQIFLRATQHNISYNHNIFFIHSRGENVIVLLLEFDAASLM